MVVQAERQLCSPESLVGTWPGRVGPDERDERGSDEDRGTTGLRAQEVSNRGAEVTRPGRCCKRVATGAGHTRIEQEKYGIRNGKNPLDEHLLRQNRTYPKSFD